MTFTAVPLTLYPDMFPGPLGHSIAGRALEGGTWACAPLNIRDHAADKHRTVDDTPAGGGAGMVLRADVLAVAVEFGERCLSNATHLGDDAARYARHAGAHPLPCGWTWRDHPVRTV